MFKIHKQYLAYIVVKMFIHVIYDIDCFIIIDGMFVFAPFPYMPLEQPCHFVFFE